MYKLYFVIKSLRKKEPLCSLKKFNKDTDKPEDELRESSSFKIFAAVMGEDFLCAKVGCDLTALIKSRRVKKTKLCLQVNIHENYCYQIINEKRYPSPEVLSPIFLVPHLSYKKANQFLRNYGYPSLYVRRKLDAAVAYALMQIWSVLQCNEFLLTNGLPSIKETV